MEQNVNKISRCSEKIRKVSKRKLVIYSAKKIEDKIGSGELVLRDNFNHSRCWDIFAKIEDLNGEEVKGFVLCRVCRRVFNYNNFSSSNLVRHRCYLEKYGKRQENVVSIIKIEPPQLNDYEVEGIGNVSTDLLKLITKWLINDCKPYGMIHDTGLVTVFQEFVSLGAKFGTDVEIDTYLPTSTTIAENVNNMYEYCCQRVKEEITTIKDNGFGLTTDIFTDSYTKQSYIALTMHYLKNGALTFCLLGLKPIDREICTTQKVNEAIETILKDFDCELTNKSLIVTSVDAMKYFKNFQTLPCISLLLHNALQKSLEGIPEVTELANTCLKLLNSLKKFELDANLSMSLQTYSPSRWITLYNMFSSIENNWTEISQTLENQKEFGLIEAINIHFLTAVTKTLQPFEEAIENLEEDNDVTLHLVFIYLHELMKSCNTNGKKVKAFDSIKRLKESLHFNLKTILTENITIIHKIAIFLYPPTNKLLLFSDREKQSIEDECRRLILEHKPKSTGITEIDPIGTPEAKRYKLFADFVEPELLLDDNELIIRELKCYKNMRVKNSADFDCFRWWELHKDVFPFLYKLSCTILATPATTASTQQIYSVAGSLLSEILNFASNETEIEKIIFIKFNNEQDEVDSQQ